MKKLDLPQNILSTWAAFEVLTPKSFKKPAALCDNNEEFILHITKQYAHNFNSIPPSPYDKKVNNERIYIPYYHIVIGSINLDIVNNLLLKRYKEGYADQEKTGKYAAIAAITVDEFGCQISLNSVSISSFAWAYPKALNGDLEDFEAWNSISSILTNDLQQYIASGTENNTVSLLNYKNLNLIFDWLVNKFSLNPEHLNKTFFAIKRYIQKGDNTLEPPLLNSPYIKDLSKAKALFISNQANNVLEYYLSTKKHKEVINLLQDKTTLTKILAPSNIPLGRWPTSPDKSLVLLQQAAINIRKNKSPEDVIITVNGPPGTGKTTLLKDIIADLIIERAIKLIEYENPKDAFKFKTKFKLGDASFKFFEINADLTGYEILIASSNNGAVENISKELPALNAIDTTIADNFDYFKIISEQFISNESADSKTWGVISAALGNAKNKNKFKWDFWDNNETGLRNYLKACEGMHITIPTYNKDKEKIGEKIPKIILQYKPSHGITALNEWKQLKKEFKNSTKKLQKRLGNLEQYTSIIKEVANLNEKLKVAQSSLKGLTSKLENLEVLFQQNNIFLSEQEQKKEESYKKYREYRKLKPNFIMKWFEKERWNWWKAQELKFYADCAEIDPKIKILATETAKTKLEIFSCQKELALINQQIAKLNSSLKERQATIGGNETTIIDTEFWEKDYNEIHQASAWMNEEILKERARIFTLAIQIHRSFIENAATPIRHNLGLLMPTFNNTSIPISEEDKALGITEEVVMSHLWQTLFLVVPVISSTFASIERMFSNLKTNSLGWLIVDEAGQATPQSAIGALMRSQNAIIVGDPFQIEPVVELPKQLTKAICNKFKVRPDFWNAPEASVQTCADLASRYGATITRNNIDQRIGIPLLVHRRCDDPMFTLSNRLAYDNLMVHGKKTADVSKVKEILGPSKWYNVNSHTTPSKWSKAEGQLVITLLKELVAINGKDPDVYLITPFREIASSMKELILQNKSVAQDLFINPYKWVNSRVGTIHTFQGKEAEAVFLILGASGRNYQGARQWAGSTVNILNVAITRAKNTLYVIGNYKDWHICGNFNILASTLPCNEFSA